MLEPIRTVETEETAGERGAPRSGMEAQWRQTASDRLPEYQRDVGKDASDESGGEGM